MALQQSHNLASPQSSSSLQSGAERRCCACRIQAWTRRGTTACRTLSHCTLCRPPPVVPRQLRPTTTQQQEEEAGQGQGHPPAQVAAAAVVVVGAAACTAYGCALWRSSVCHRSTALCESKQCVLWLKPSGVRTSGLRCNASFRPWSLTLLRLLLQPLLLLLLLILSRHVEEASTAAAAATEEHCL